MAGQNILIVEDENIIADDLEGKLKTLGFGVSAVVSTGLKAIEMAAETRPDLVLMDIVLKGDMDGVEAAEEIRRCFDIPVVYLTAYADDRTLQRAKATGPGGYILKPFKERELKTTIELALYKDQVEKDLKKARDELEIRVAERTRELVEANEQLQKELTERRRMEEALVRVNRLLKILSECNEALVHATEEARLLEEVCRIIVQVGGYCFVRVGLTMEDDRRSVRPVVQRGFPVNAVDLSDESETSGRGEGERGRWGEGAASSTGAFCKGGMTLSSPSLRVSPSPRLKLKPTALGLEEGCPEACRLSLSDSEMGHGSAEAVMRKEGPPFIAVPLLAGKDLLGVMEIHADRADAFSDDEIKLLTELADDLAYGIVTIRSHEEHQRAWEALRQAQKMEALGTLAGGIAHDFNNILAIIVGYTEMAFLNTGKGGAPRESLQEVLKAADRAKGLVRQILTFSRRGDKERKPVEIGLIVKEVLKMLRASLPSTLEIRPEVKTNAVVLADPTQIHQVLMNLCTNSAHAMEESGGIIRVSLTEVRLGPEAIQPHSDLMPGLHVKLTVRDTGHGIPPALLNRIFDPFFTTKEPGVGTGLGLAVVHGIVKSHGGAIEVESFPGKGTAVQVLLPVIEGSPKPESAAAVPLARGKERVLVVDDEPALALVARDMLERLGYEAEARTSSIEALEVFRRRLMDKPFELVITDMTMPHLTGTDLARELCRLQPALPIILCTGFSGRIDEEKAESLGIRGLLIKPFGMRDLAEMIRKVLYDGGGNRRLSSRGERFTGR